LAKVDFKLDKVELEKNLDQFGAEINKRITLAVDFAAGEGVRDMKTKAPWTDRTTAARSGLVAVPEHKGSSAIGFATHHIVFAHAVTYGIWLEIANHKKYQIIMPTVIDVGKELMRELSTLFDDLDSHV
jgi:hypothetical protein